MQARRSGIILFPKQFSFLLKVRVFEKYDERTKTCFGRCPDGSMSPDCTYGQYIGPGVSSAGRINNVRASDPYARGLATGGSALPLLLLP